MNRSLLVPFASVSNAAINSRLPPGTKLSSRGAGGGAISSKSCFMAMLLRQAGRRSFQVKFEAPNGVQRGRKRTRLVILTYSRLIGLFTIRQIPPLNPPDKSPSLTYRDAGVDIDAGDALVENIKPFAKKTLRPEVLAGIGGFGALPEIPKRDPGPGVGSGADGGGTPLKLALPPDRHDTRGAAPPALTGTDNLGEGAEPLFFLDYY